MLNKNEKGLRPFEVCVGFHLMTVHAGFVDISIFLG